MPLDRHEGDGATILQREPAGMAVPVIGRYIMSGFFLCNADGARSSRTAYAIDPDNGLTNASASHVGR